YLSSAGRTAPTRSEPFVPAYIAASVFEFLLPSLFTFITRWDSLRREGRASFALLQEDQVGICILDGQSPVGEDRGDPPDHTVDVHYGCALTRANYIARR